MADRVEIIKDKSDSNNALALAALGTEALQTVRSIISELIRAAAINPYMSVTVMVLVSDILRSNNIITQGANEFVLVTGATVTAASAISDILGGGLLKPSAQTLVYGQDQLSMTSALMSKLAGST